MTAKTGLASISEGRTDLLQINPDDLHMVPGWNERDMKDPKNVAYIAELAASINKIGVREPLTVYWKDGKAWVTNGHCRLLAIRLLKEQGIIVKRVPVKNAGTIGNEADRLFDQIILNSGKPLEAMEKARVYKRLLDLGWTQSEIAEKEGKSQGSISQTLALLNMTPNVQTMVSTGQVAATTALKVHSAADNGTEAEKQLKAGLEAAKAEGKTKVTTSNLAPVAVIPKESLKVMLRDILNESTIDRDGDEGVVTVRMSEMDYDRLMAAVGIVENENNYNGWK